MANERQQKILQFIGHKGEIQLQGLKDLFPEVSIMTLRRDLTSLESEGHLIRTHGGAVSIKKLAAITGEEDEYSRRAAENIEAKMKIARKAVTLVEKGRSIYFDAGSTIMCLAEILPDENYSIVTSGANIALEIVKKQRSSIVVLGGPLNRNTLSISGPGAETFLEKVNIDLAFMSASGFSTRSGFTVSNIYECELKKKVVKQAKKVIMLLDAAKLNRELAFTYATLEDIDIWVCEKELPPEIETEAERKGVEAVV